MSSLVSIIIPCYNQGNFLADAVESVLAQSYRPREIIVVNDGSTDDTPTIAAKHPDVHYLEQSNRGLSEARNQGLRASAGSYLVFLDADDRLCPNALTKGVECLNARPECAFAAGHYREISADGSLLAEPVELGEGVDPYADFLRTCWVGLPGAVIYQRWVFEAVGLFDTSLRHCEEYELYLRVTRRFPVARHGSVVAEYRRHGANKSNNFEGLMRVGLAVRRRHWRYARQSPNYRTAYRQGDRIWRHYWGEPLLEQLHVAIEQHQWVSAARRLQVLLRYWPAGVTTAARQVLGRPAG